MSLLAMRAKVHKVICTGHKYNKTMEHIKAMLYLLLQLLRIQFFQLTRGRYFGVSWTRLVRNAKEGLKWHCLHWWHTWIHVQYSVFFSGTAGILLKGYVLSSSTFIKSRVIMIMISVIWAYSNCYQFNIQTTQIFFYTKIQGSNLQ